MSAHVRVHAYGTEAGRIRGPARGLSGLCIRGDYLWAPRVRVRTACVSAWPNPLVAPVWFSPSLAA